MALRVLVEDEAGSSSKFDNSDYEKAGATIEKRGAVYKDCDVLVKINPFDEDGLKLIDKTAYSDLSTFS